MLLLVLSCCYVCRLSLQKGQQVTSEVIKAPFSISRRLDQSLQGKFDLIVFRGDVDPPAFMDGQSE